MNLRNPAARARIALIASMAIFGTIGIVRTYLLLPSGILAMVRGAIGALFLVAWMGVRRQRFDRAAWRRAWFPLVASGAMIGFNWILLFEAYRYTSVPIATMCYYTAPALVMLCAPLVSAERLTVRKVACIVVALAGMVLVSGLLTGEQTGTDHRRGVLLGLGAAILYAAVILTNKRLTAVPAYDKTVTQLATAAVVLVPYTLLAGEWRAAAFTPLTIVLLAAVGVVHTGVAYALYFGAIGALPAQTVALFSYLDPVIAVLLAVPLLHQPLSLLGWIGAALILGSTMLGERA